MDDAGLDALTTAVERMHDCRATWVESIPVTETFRGEVAWQGEVQRFTLAGHPKAREAFAWSHLVNETGRRRFYAVLAIAPVVDAVTAVRAAIASGS